MAPRVRGKDADLFYMMYLREKGTGAELIGSALKAFILRSAEGKGEQGFWGSTTLLLSCSPTLQNLWGFSSFLHLPM